MKPIKKLPVLLVFCLLSTAVLAKKTTYIYTDGRFNFVKISEMNKKEGLDLAVNHPFAFNDEQMRAVLKEVKLNRSFVIDKEVETQDIFDDRAISFLAPKLVEAFSKADSKNKVVFSYLTKDPRFVLRNDRITICSAWVHGTELHIVFDKLFAKVSGDYDKKGDMSKIVARARGLRVSLAVRDGQMLGESSVSELVIDTTHDFDEPPIESAIAGTFEGDTAKVVPPSSNPTAKERLKELESLKKEGLVTDEEYKTKREEILKGL